MYSIHFVVLYQKNLVYGKKTLNIIIFGMKTNINIRKF